MNEIAQKEKKKEYLDYKAYNERKGFG